MPLFLNYRYSRKNIKDVNSVFESWEKKQFKNDIYFIIYYIDYTLSISFTEPLDNHNVAPENGFLFHKESKRPKCKSKCKSKCLSLR